MPTNLKLNDKLIEETVKLGHFKSKQQAVNTALAEFVQRRQRLRILDLAGKIEFDPEWNYKNMRRSRSAWFKGLHYRHGLRLLREARSN